MAQLGQNSARPNVNVTWPRVECPAPAGRGSYFPEFVVPEAHKFIFSANRPVPFPSFIPFPNVFGARGK
jgi:hypothetical protein